MNRLPAPQHYVGPGRVHELAPGVSGEDLKRHPWGGARRLASTQRGGRKKSALITERVNARDEYAMAAGGDSARLARRRIRKRTVERMNNRKPLRLGSAM